MKKCSECGSGMKELEAKTPEGVSYTYFKCGACGEEILNMNQLHAVAEKYREMKRYHVKLSEWGGSIGLRIPKELAKRYNFRNEEKVTVVPEEKGIRVLPA
jgi:DNA-directed RNA polymerase subunit M/transcription elongation factor TFIIS